MRESRSRAWTGSSAVALIAVITLTLGGLTSITSPAAAAPRFGGTVFERPGETYAQAFKRVTRTYGGLDAVRLFFPGAPSSWSSIRANVGRTPVVVSFRMDPARVLSGAYDRQMQSWFAAAPTNRPTYWSYWHEPENDGVDPSLYRRAWQRLDVLADRARNPRLQSTLILMCWTLDPKSGRNWKSYYAGSSAIRVLAFDCYNTGRKKGVYKAPKAILRNVVRLAKRVDKPWGIAEFGSTSIRSDGGNRGRALWLKKYARYVQKKGGRFATYFDSYVGYDYRLHDKKSRTAWKRIVSR